MYETPTVSKNVRREEIPSEYDLLTKVDEPEYNVLTPTGASAQGTTITNVSVSPALYETPTRSPRRQLDEPERMDRQPENINKPVSHVHFNKKHSYFKLNFYFIYLRAYTYIVHTLMSPLSFFFPPFK